MDTIKVGVIGAGANTRFRHIPGFQAIEGVSVEVVCNRSESSSRSVAEAFGIPRIAATWQEVVNDPGIDAICIGTWPYLHAEITIAALGAGKHVLTEARMAMDAAEAEQMLAASMNRLDLVAQVVPSPFTLKWDQTIHRILASGELGDLREIVFSKTLSSNVDSDAPLNWRQSKVYSGNNVLMLGIYYEVVMRWLGREPEKLWASGAVFTQERYDNETESMVAVEVPDTVDVLAVYEDGLRLSGRVSGLELGSGSDFYAICGSYGSLRLDLKQGKLFRTLLGEPEREILPAEEEISSWRVEADFIESIRSGTPARLTGFEDGLAYMRFTDAVARSSSAGGEWTLV